MPSFVATTFTLTFTLTLPSFVATTFALAFTLLGRVPPMLRHARRHRSTSGTLRKASKALDSFIGIVREGFLSLCSVCKETCIPSIVSLAVPEMSEATAASDCAECPGFKGEPGVGGRGLEGARLTTSAPDFLVAARVLTLATGARGLRLATVLMLASMLATGARGLRHATASHAISVA